MNRLSAISGITGAQFEAVIERCINSGRSCVVLVHSVVPSPSVAIEVSTAAFTHLCAYLHRRRAMVDFVTLPQLFLRLVDPSV